MIKGIIRFICCFLGWVEKLIELHTFERNARSLCFLALLSFFEALAVVKVEKAGESASNQRAKHEGVDVVRVDAVSVLQVIEREGAHGQTDSWVKATSELAASFDAGEESEHDDESTGHTVCRRARPHAFDHQDDADEDRCQDDLVDEYLHVEVEF